MNAPTPEFTQACKDAEFFETPTWAAKRILDVELLSHIVVDPCAGRGVLGRAARDRGYIVHEYDLNAWPDQLPGNRIASGVDFLGPFDKVAHQIKGGEFGFGEADFTILMNPPFTRTVEFIERGFRLGARKIVMFQRLAFLESGGRRDFFQRMMPTRIWICGDRATCWRGDVPAEDLIDENGKPVLGVDGKPIRGRKGRSAPTPHAWFIFEAGHRGAGAIQHLYKE